MTFFKEVFKNIFYSAKNLKMWTFLTSANKAIGFPLTLK